MPKQPGSSFFTYSQPATTAQASSYIPPPQQNTRLLQPSQASQKAGNNHFGSGSQLTYSQAAVAQPNGFIRQNQLSVQQFQAYSDNQENINQYKYTNNQKRSSLSVFVPPSDPQNKKYQFSDWLSDKRAQRCTSKDVNGYFYKANSHIVL